MTRHIAFSNQKGGVTKTTSSTNFAACAAEKGYKVLFVDLDHQSNGTTLLGEGVIPEDAYTVLDLMLEVNMTGFYTTVDPEYPRIGIDQLAHNVRENLDLIPAHTKMQNATLDLASADRREDLLRCVFPEIVSGYDFVVYDCPPSIDLLVKNAFSVGEVEVYIPVDCGAFSDRGFMKMIQQINKQKVFNPLLRLKGSFLAKYFKGQKATDKVEAYMVNNFGEILMSSQIRVCADLVNAAIEGQTIFEFKRRSRGAEDYISLTEEIIGG